MKKLFTLALVLMVTFVGYSQVRNVSYKDAQHKVATMQQAPRMEAVNANVQSQPNMTRSDGELDYTAYDWQSNAAARAWTITWPDGKVSFAYTIASDGYADRGTAIGTYDAVNDEWIPGGGRIENEKTGFGSIARYGQNGIVVAAHNSSTVGIFIIENKDEVPALQGSVAAAGYLSEEKEPTWASVMTSGANRDIIHVLATAYSEDGNPLYYYRSQDGGQTWDKDGEAIPFLTSEYGSDWGSNIAYWMETTEDNRLAFVVSNAWSDCMVVYSDDNGETWERKVFWHHPGINTTMDDWFMYPRWTSAQWGVDGELCLAFEFNGTTGEPGAGTYYPSLGGVGFWSENLIYTGEGYASNGYDPTNPKPATTGQTFIMDSAYMFNDIYAAWPRWSDQTWDNPVYFGYVPCLTDNGEWESYEEAESFNIEDFSLHGSYNSGCAGMPVLCVVPGSNGWDMVTVWIAMDENNMDGNGNYYYKLFAAYSGDAGRTWQGMTHLTNDFLFSYSECVYPQATIIGNTLIIAAQMDSETGSYVMGNDGEPDDNYYQGLTYDLTELFGASVGVEENVNNNVHMSIYPNPAVDQLNVTLSKSANIVVYNIMGQVIRTQEGRIGGNTIDLNGLNAGVYFISAGSDTQKFIVK